MIEQFLGKGLALAERYGVKSVVSGVAIWQLGELITAGHIPGIPGAAGIVVVAVGFMIARHFEHKQNGNGGNGK